MGGPLSLRETLRGRRVYFDTMIFIYLVEGFSELQAGLDDIRDCLLHGEAEVVTSHLSLCEALVHPFRTNNAERAAAYRDFIERSGAFTLLPATLDIWIRASLYTGQFGLKTPDALHVASAVEADCEIFLTNDRRITAPEELRIVGMG